MCEVTEGKKEAPYPEQGCRQLVLVEGMVCSREGQRRVEGDVLRSARQDRHEENQIRPIRARRFREQTMPSRIWLWFKDTPSFLSAKAGNLLQYHSALSGTSWP